MTDVVQKFWGFCHTLRHDGIDYGEYIEQITYLLFLKLADERAIDLSRVPSGGEEGTVDGSWPTLRATDSERLLAHYGAVLRALGRQPGLLGDIFQGALSRFNQASNLKRLIDLIGEMEWTALEVDLKAAIFEGLLEKAANEGKKGAGQYFTPRLLIQAIVRCVKPDPRLQSDFALCDPACGTGGFLVVAYEGLKSELAGVGASAEVVERIRSRTYFGAELVQRPRRLALMNLYLHGLAPEIRLGDSIYEPAEGRTFDVVLTNPPFGSRGANQVPQRADLSVKTSHKQLNFLQHVLTLLKPGGRAAVVVPDNCLFADQAGEVFEILTRESDLHTVLRLPNGTFSPYSAGTKTNVVFFTKGPATETVWIYDARTNVEPITKKSRPLTRDHLVEFERCFGSDPLAASPRRATDSSSGRWRPFSIHDVRACAFKIDGLKWLREEGGREDAETEPEALAALALEDLDAAVVELAALVEMLRGGDEAQRRPRVVRGRA